MTYLAALGASPEDFPAVPLCIYCVCVANSAALLNCSWYNVETDLAVIGNQGWKEVAVKKDSDLVVLCIVEGELRANVIKAHLESEGIPALLKYESAGRVFGLTVNGLGAVKILVPKELEEEAKKIIEPSKGDETEIH